jgi:hypothetical protein
MAKKNKVLADATGIDSVNWAIVCHLKPHQFAHRINQACGWSLKRLRNLSPNTTVKNASFALYNYFVNDMQPEYFLVSLKDEKSFLVKELKQFDYILQTRLHDEDTKWNPEKLMEMLKNMENVLGVFELSIQAVKNADALFFDKQLDHLEITETVTTMKKITSLNK